ncbi:MAG: DNA cytosine methyltransferase [Verrucomicrobiota bacterium]
MISTNDRTGVAASRQSKCSENSVVSQNIKPTAPGTFDFCSGLGGISLAGSKLGLQVVAGVDVNANALKTFSRNFPNAAALAGSVRSKTVLDKCKRLVEQFRAAQQPVIILSGPPCQGFSAAGSRDPSDRRNKVLVAVARAIALLQPDCALVENVSMLLSDKYEGRVESFEQTIRQAGYHVAHIVLDASEFGVPQKRERAFFLVTRQPLDIESVNRRLELFKSKAVNVRQALRGLPTPEARPDRYKDELDNGQITNHFAMQHSERVKKKIAAIEPGKGPMSYRRLHPTRLSNTLFSGHRAPPAHFEEPRSITVREAARLQGFPDNFRIYGAFANQMEQVTNAVPPPLATVVLSVLLEFTNIPVCQHG